MNVQAISDDTKDIILDNFQTVTDYKAIGPFCVDGRDGDVIFAGSNSSQHLYVQSLGGSLLLAVINYLQNGADDFTVVLRDTINKLKLAGYGVGVHRGSHRNDAASDCGFADNLPKILARLADDADEIRDLIESVAPGTITDEVWATVVKSAKAGGLGLPGFINGEGLIASAQNMGANIQTLDGDHAEVAAIVNLKSGTSLNTGNLVENGLQAFNLDLWYVNEAAGVLGLDQAFATQAALGLYVATEMVLVEDKKQIRLPIIVND